MVQTQTPESSTGSTSNPSASATGSTSAGTGGTTGTGAGTGSGSGTSGTTSGSSTAGTLAEQVAANLAALGLTGSPMSSGTQNKLGAVQAGNPLTPFLIIGALILAGYFYYRSRHNE